MLLILFFHVVCGGRAKKAGEASVALKSSRLDRTEVTVSQSVFDTLFSGPAAIIALYPHTSTALDGPMGVKTIQALENMPKSDEDAQRSYKAITSGPKAIRMLGYKADNILDASQGMEYLSAQLQSLVQNRGFGIIFPEGHVDRQREEHDGISPNFIEMASQNSMDIIFGYFDTHETTGGMAEFYLSERFQLNGNLPSYKDAVKSRDVAIQYWSVINDMVQKGRTFFAQKDAVCKSVNPWNAAPWRTMLSVRKKYINVYPEIMDQTGQEDLDPLGLYRMCHKYFSKIGIKTLSQMSKPGNKDLKTKVYESLIEDWYKFENEAVKHSVETYLPLGMQTHTDAGNAAREHGSKKILDFLEELMKDTIPSLTSDNNKNNRANRLVKIVEDNWPTSSMGGKGTKRIESLKQELMQRLHIPEVRSLCLSFTSFLGIKRRSCNPNGLKLL